LLALMLFMAWGAQAQFSLRGTITDAKSNEALVGSTVVLKNARMGSTTNANGAFVFNNLPKGSYTLVVSFVGYKTYEQVVEVEQDVNLNITLEESTFMTDEVVVSATRAKAKTPTTFTTIDRDALEKTNLGQDMPFLLDQTPSVVVTSDAGAGVGYTGIRIRGSDPTRINVTVNGIPLNDAESHGVFWVNMPDFASSVNDIQVQRGVGTSTNGAAAFGASINIKTTDSPTQPYAELSNSAGSFNTWRHTVRAGTGLINDHFTFDVRLSQITSDGYIDRAFSDLRSWYAAGSYYSEKSMVKMVAFSGREQTYQAWLGVPENLLETDRTHNPYTYENQTDNYGQDHYQLIGAHDLTPDITLNAALHYTYGRGYFEEFRENDDLADYNIGPIVLAGNDTVTNANVIRRRWLDNDFYGTTFSAEYAPANGPLELTVGGAWHRYEGRHFGEAIWAEYTGDTELGDRYYENDATKTDFNVFAKAYYQLNSKLNMFADLQVRAIDYTFIGFDRNGVNVEQTDNLRFFNPKAGLTYNLQRGQILYASYAVGQREPVRDDYVESSPDSRPEAERLQNIEVGYRLERPGQQLSVNFYHMDYTNQLILTGQVNDVGAFTRTNVDRSNRTGIEINASTALAPKLSVAANATFSQNRIDNFTEFIDNFDEGGQVQNNYRNTDIAFSPNIIAGATLSYRPVSPVELRLIGKYVGRQFLDNTANEDRSLDAFFVNHVQATYDLSIKGFKQVQLNLLVNNVFNTLFEPNGYTFSFISEGQLQTFNNFYPQAGTNFLLGLKVGF